MSRFFSPLSSLIIRVKACCKNLGGQWQKQNMGLYRFLFGPAQKCLYSQNCQQFLICSQVHSTTITYFNNPYPVWFRDYRLCRRLIKQRQPIQTKHKYPLQIITIIWDGCELADEQKFVTNFGCFLVHAVMFEN